MFVLKKIRKAFNMKAKKDVSCGSNEINEIIPFEILVKIFSYLPFSHLKKARLVCTRWYKASKDVMILRKQNFVFTPKNPEQYEDELEEMFTTIADGNFSYYNLKFIDVKWADDVFERFVSSHGANIYSLCFQKCTFSFKVIENIMIYCINLKELNFDGEDDDDLSHSNTLLQMPRDPQIPMINGRKIIRENLTRLKLIFNESISDDLLSVLINVYPSIKKLHLLPDNYDSEIIRKFYQIPEFRLRFPGILTLEVCKKLFPVENLIAVWNKLSSERSYVLALGLTMRYGSITELNVVEMEFENLPVVFQNFPNLEHLKVRLFPKGDVITGVSNVLKLIAESRLRSLSLFFFDNYNYNMRPEETIDDIPWMNQSMERFSIRALNFRHNLAVQMLKMFPNLASLHFRAKLDSEILKQDVTSYIFERLVKLKSLSLYLITVDSTGLQNTVDDSLFKNCNFFPNLEHLALRGFKRLTKKCVKKFANFPNLKYLNLEECKNMEDSGVVELTQILPYLEWLNIFSGNPVSDEMLFRISHNLKYLRCLDLQLKTSLSSFHLSRPSPAIELFDLFPTLRYLQRNRFFEGWIIYDYHKKTTRKHVGPDPFVPNDSPFYYDRIQEKMW